MIAKNRQFLMTFFGNLLLGVFFISLLLLLIALATDLATQDVRRAEDEMYLFVYISLTGAQWLCLPATLGIVTSLGGFNWVISNRFLQYFVVFLVFVAIGIVSGASLIFPIESKQNIPAVLRWLRPWVAFVLPSVIMFYNAWWLNPTLRKYGSVRIWQFLLLTIALFSVISAGPLVWLWHTLNQEQNSAQVETSLEKDDKRDQAMLAELRALKPEESLVRSLGFTNKYETPAIRELALNIVENRPHLTDELIELIDKGGSWEVLTYLESNDPPDRVALAEPVKRAILAMSAHIRKMMREERVLYDDTFDRDIEKILAVTEKFNGLGVDYGPAMRELRLALDEPRDQKINPGKRIDLDQWLGGHPVREK